jgi:hypothetical protein
MNHSKMDHTYSTIPMFIIMIIAGLLSSMNVWTDKLSDIRLHLNDIYMAILMTGWMFSLMGLYYMNMTQIILGTIIIIIMLYMIRKQTFINESQYLSGMIPHHSMAVLMSKRLLEKNLSLESEIKQLAINIISSQESEINLMKKYA